MKGLSIFLTAIYSLFAGAGIVTVIMGATPITTLLIVIVEIATAAALNNKGGKFARYSSYLASFVLSLFIFAALYIAISPFWGERMDLKLVVICALMGVVGLATFYCIKKQPATTECKST